MYHFYCNLLHVHVKQQLARKEKRNKLRDWIQQHITLQSLKPQAHKKRLTDFLSYLLPLYSS